MFMVDKGALAILKLHPNSTGKYPSYASIKEGIMDLSGVKDVQINYATDMMKVHYDAAILNLKMIQGKLEQLESTAE